MREKVEEFVANKKASIEVKDNVTVKVAEPANDDKFDMASLLLIGKENAYAVRPSIKAEIAKEVELVIKFGDELALKNKKYHEDYVVRGTQALYGVLTDIYALALKIENSNAKDHILREMRDKLKARDIKTQFNTPTMTIVIKYVVGAERQTAANYSRVLGVAMQDNITANGLADYISRRGGISQIHDTEINSTAKLTGSKVSKERLDKIQEMFQLQGHSSDHAFSYKGPVYQLNSHKQNKAETGRFVVFVTVFDDANKVYKIAHGFDLGQTFENSLFKILSKEITAPLDSIKLRLRSFKKHLIETKKVHQGWINSFNREFEAEEKSKQEVSSEGDTA
jgi:hypothetical protein